MNEETEARQYYHEYYGRKGSDRNDLSTNRGVLFQTLAQEASVVDAVRRISHNPRTATVLDVGCGGGNNLFQLLRLKYQTENISGIDLQSERINEARRMYPSSHFVQGDASRMEFGDASFDLVYESTMFATLTDDKLCAGIAREMLRVCRPGGYLLLVDWSFPHPRSTTYKALSRQRLTNLFGLGTTTQLVSVSSGALVPPIGRFLSRYAQFAYFGVSTFLPFLVGQVAYLLQRTAQSIGPSLDRVQTRTSTTSLELREETGHLEAAA